MPPFVGDAKKATLSPVQMVVVPETAAGVDAILTEGVTVAFTVMVIFEVVVAVEEVTHPPVTVIAQEITSPVTKVLVVYVLAVSPGISDPFFFH